MFLNKNNKSNEGSKIQFAITDKLCEHFREIHNSCLKTGATPRQYLNFLDIYVTVYTSKKGGIEKKRNHLQVMLLHYQKSEMIFFVIFPLMNFQLLTLRFFRCFMLIFRFNIYCFFLTFMTNV